MIKNNFRILKKPHAYLQTILKAPVKFQKDWPKTVGGVEGTRYLLKIRNHALRTTESRKQCPSAFLQKGGGQLGRKCGKFVWEFQFLYRPGHAKACRMTYANTKRADQTVYAHSLIIAFVVRCLDSMVYILVKSKVSTNSSYLLWLTTLV